MLMNLFYDIYHIPFAVCKYLWRNNNMEHFTTLCQ